MPDCVYLLPLRRKTFSGAETAEWRHYLEQLSRTACEILVIDGSPAEVFAEHHALLHPVCRHIGVDHGYGYLNDKVNGIHTGVAAVTQEKIILADDDIRYRPEQIDEIVRLLERFEVVRPQNFLSPLPWWGMTESARMLINRATLRTGDYPGTCAFRRSTFLRAGHYDGDVLFDNEEMIRHFATKHATIAYALNFFVQKKPPRFRKWLEQRPRQAYEDFGLRTKTALFVSVPPLLVAIAFFLGKQGVAVGLGLGAVVSTCLALAGWLRGRARNVIPIWCCFFAPLWVAERTLSTYAALYWYLTRRGYPFGDRVLSKGIGRSWRAGGRLAVAHNDPSRVA
jgi:hypothetical protein